MNLVRMTAAGLYCEAGGFHIDPGKSAAMAIITHGHADHLTKGCRRYLTARQGLGIVRERLGPQADIQTLEYGETLEHHGVRISLHPAGHVLGSAQVRLEHQGEVWVVTGDYRTMPDDTCAPFEPVPCHTLLTESTFGHPFFQWPDPAQVVDELQAWWKQNQAEGKASFVYVYALGKAQRLLSRLDDSLGPIGLHPQVLQMTRLYEAEGIHFPRYSSFDHLSLERDWSRVLLLMPPSARWQQPCPFFGHYSTAFVSGWMLHPDGPRQRHVSRGFVLSDHVAYDEILATLRRTGAERVGVMHGFVDRLVTDLTGRGYDAFPLKGAFHKDPTLILPCATARD